MRIRCGSPYYLFGLVVLSEGTPCLQHGEGKVYAVRGLDQRTSFDQFGVHGMLIGRIDNRLAITPSMVSARSMRSMA